MAPAAAAALPPPGVAVGAASCSINGSDTSGKTADGRLAAHDRCEAVFKYERGIEVLRLQEPLGGLLQSQFRNQSHNLARYRNNAVARCLSLHKLEDAVDGRLF